MEIEDTISLTVSTENAPELFKADMEWIANETRASEAIFNDDNGISDGFESFEVDGISVRFIVEKN